MRLIESQVKLLAKKSGLSEKSVERLIGSIKVEITKLNGSAQSQFELALRINNPEQLQLLFMNLNSEQIVERLVCSLIEYKQCCPLIAAWVSRGDFNPTKIPNEIKYAHIKHGSITAGRLRSGILRNI